MRLVKSEGRGRRAGQIRTVSERQQQPAATPDDLLRTKLAPPRLQGPFVAREALLARLDEGLAGKVTLVAAPAGFGKTTLVRQWLASRSSELGLSSSELPQPQPAQNSELTIQNFARLCVTVRLKPPHRLLQRDFNRCLGQAQFADGL